MYNIIISVFILMLVNGCAGNVKYWSLGDFPDDFFSPLIINDIDISKTGNFKTPFFCAKYTGKHAVGIFFKKLPKEFPMYNFGNYHAELRIDFFLEDKLILSRINVIPIAHYSSSDRNSLFLEIINVPEDIPLQKNIFCSISVINTDGEFSKKYSPVRFFVKKIFEY